MENQLRKDLSSTEMLKVIFDYVGRVARERKVEPVLRLVSDMAREIVISDRCTVWLLDEENHQLWTKVAHGVSEIRIPASSGLVGHAIKDDIEILIEDAYNDDRFNQDVDKRTGYRTKSMIVIPMKNNDGKIIGAFQAINKMTASGTFSKNDLEHLVLASSYSAMSVEAAMLHKEIEETQRDVIFTMGEIGESRSKETGNHVKRVAEYSKLLAVKYGLSEEDSEILKLASPMHDIGKVGIPDSILKKPGRLTAEEFEIMKTHAQLGYEMLKKSKRTILKAAAIVAAEHHEKWNGKGYPEGKMGENIHIFGRITAVADVFDALASDRVYKKAWELDRILALFKAEQGEHFDPKLVEILFDHLDDFLLIKEQYKDILEEEVTLTY